MAKPILIVDELMSWSLGSVIAELLDRTGLDPSMYDVGYLEGKSLGFLVGQNSTVASVIDELTSNHCFDISNHGGTLNFVPRGTNPVAKLYSDDLVDGSKTDTLEIEDSISIPRVINVEYMDIDGGLTPDLQTSDRSADMRAKSETNIKSAETMTADQAKQLAVISHKLAIEEQSGKVECSIPLSHIKLAVADVILLNDKRYRIIESEISSTEQKLTIVPDRKSAYSTSIKGIPAVKPVDPPEQVVGPTRVVVMDTAVLDDQDDELGVYLAIERTTQTWQGVVIETSIDGGENYDQQDYFDTETIIGELLTPLATHPQAYPDVHNKCRIKVSTKWADIPQLTLREALNRKGLAFINGELINVMDAEQVGNNEWELSYFLRGRKGTQPQTHAVGSQLVFLDIGDYYFVPLKRYDIGRTFTLRITSAETEQSQVISYVFTAQGQQERAPAYLKAQRTGNNMAISWQGVGRLGGGMYVGMGQHFKHYLVTLPNGTQQQTTEQTLNVPYQSGVIKVQQVNELTGAGTAIEVRA